MLVEFIRSLIVFAHLMIFSGAIVMVLVTDYSIIKHGVNRDELKTLTHRVVGLFGLLWLTGLTLVFIDTAFDFALIRENPKLVLKLFSVLVLTLNGISLHLIGLKILYRIDPVTTTQSAILCVTGAMSTTNWLLAGFIGSANFLVHTPLQELLLSYLAVLVAACFVGFLLTKPMQQRLNWHRARETLSSKGITPYTP